MASPDPAGTERRATRGLWLNGARRWFDRYLSDCYCPASVGILPRTDVRMLRDALNAAEVGRRFPESSAWNMKLDVVGVIQFRDHPQLAFLQIKTHALSLADVGQFLGYCMVCQPAKAFLFSPAGLSGDLKRLLHVYGRTDVLVFGAHTMRVGTWRTDRGEPDWGGVTPPGEMATQCWPRRPKRRRKAQGRS